MISGIERAKQRRAARDASGEVYVDGSIYEGMAACLVRSGRTIAHVVDYADAVAIAAAMATPPASDSAVSASESRFWLIVREPGMVPERKGSWPHRDIAKTLREFIAARPRAFIDVLTIGPDGTPDVDHGPEMLQMLDGRSMSVGSKHNARVRAAAEEALAAAPKVASDTGAGLPRLTRAMMRAACKAHYGDDNIDGISLTADGHDYNFAQGFARMWKGVRKVLATPTNATDGETGR